MGNHDETHYSDQTLACLVEHHGWAADVRGEGGALLSVEREIDGQTLTAGYGDDPVRRRYIALKVGETVAVDVDGRGMNPADVARTIDVAATRVAEANGHFRAIALLSGGAPEPVDYRALRGVLLAPTQGSVVEVLLRSGPAAAPLPTPRPGSATNDKWRPAAALREGDLFLWLSPARGVVAEEVREVHVASGFARIVFKDTFDLLRTEGELQRVATDQERAAIREHRLEGVQHLREELTLHAAAVTAREREDAVRNDPYSTSEQRHAAKDARKAAEFAAMVAEHPEILQDMEPETDNDTPQVASEDEMASGPAP